MTDSVGKDFQLDVICGLSLLLVFVPALRVFLQVLRFSSLSKFQFNLERTADTFERVPSWLFGASWVNKLHFIYNYI